MKDERIARLAPSHDGSRKYRCPECSQYRRNKWDTPLSITRRGTLLLYRCHNCGWKGGYDEARRAYNPMGNEKKDIERHTEGVQRWRRDRIVW